MKATRTSPFTQVSQKPCRTHKTRRMNRERTRTKLIVFGSLAACIILVALFAPFLCPYDPNAQDLSLALQAPSTNHLLGCDRYGRDLLSRIIIASTQSVFSALVLIIISATGGTIIGLICGWKANKLDAVLMRLSDIFLAIPGIVFALAIAGILGGGMMNAILALAIITWPKYARLSRSLTLAQKNEPYLAASRLAGCTTAQLIVRHILPNIAGSLLITALLDIGTVMIELAGLSFLGFGVQVPTAEWGAMISDGRSLLQIAPWMTIFPGAAIFLTVAIFNLFSDTLRDFMNPDSFSRPKSFEVGATIKAKRQRADKEVGRVNSDV